MTPTWSLDQALIGIVASLARATPAVWLVPFLAGRVLPGSFRVAVAAALGVVMFPFVATDAQLLAGVAPLIVAGLLVKEVFVGLCVGLIASLIFWAAQAAGGLVDTAGGTAQGETSSPFAGGQATPQGHLLLLFTVVVFLSLGGHRLFVLALARSYEVLPLRTLPTAEGVRGVAVLAITLTGELIGVAVTLAAPAIVTVLLVDVTLGWLNRFSPQLNAYFVAMPLKGLIGVGVMIVVIFGLLALFPEMLAIGMQQIERAIGLLAT